MSGWRGQCARSYRLLDRFQLTVFQCAPISNIRSNSGLASATTRRHQSASNKLLSRYAFPPEVASWTDVSEHFYSTGGLSCGLRHSSFSSMAVYKSQDRSPIRRGERKQSRDTVLPGNLFSEAGMRGRWTCLSP